MSRGFSQSEFEGRVARVQSMMAEHDLAAIMVTTHPDVYYFTGFLTRFWASPARPWFVIVPQSGKPVAVIPGIGAALMQTTWLEDIRTWAAPDLEDDGVSLLGETLREIAGNGRVGIPDGHESALRMPVADFERLKHLPNMPKIVSDQQIVRKARIIKSDAEVAKIQTACDIAGRAFDRVHEFARPGVALEAVFRKFQMACLDEGADWVPYLAGGFGPEGYSDVISPASDTPLKTGDCLMLDTGLVHDGYFCDYDRNFSMGPASEMVSDAHKKIIEATVAGFDAAKPGARACDLYHAMDKVLTGGEGRNDNGRLGHGLGIDLTEWPSFIAMDETMLEPGMVLTLEPGVETRNGNMLVHEENIVITETGARYLSTPQGPDIRTV